MLKTRANIFFVILAVTIGLSECYVYMTEISTHPDHPGQCYSTETQKAYNVGEFYQRKTVCEKLTCLGNFRFDAMGCGTRSINAPHCHKVDPDLTLPYPECCKTYECINPDGTKVRM